MLGCVKMLQFFFGNDLGCSKETMIVGKVSVVLFLLIGSHLHLRVLANVAYESIIYHF